MALSLSDWFVANDIECSRLTAINASFPRHTHDEYVISANLSGTEQIWLNGKTSLVQSGEITVYNPASIQSSLFGSEKVEFCSVHLPQSLLRSLTNNHNLSSDRQAPVLTEGVLRNPALFDAICRYACTPHDAVEQEQNLLWLLGTLLDDRTADHPQPAETVGRALEFMRDNLTLKISLDTLAQVSGMSKYHFVRQFRQRVGMPPLQYHMQLRLLEARNLLRQNQHTLDVALALGFYDQSHFINAFRKTMGITPHHYLQSFTR